MTGSLGLGPVSPHAPLAPSLIPSTHTHTHTQPSPRLAVRRERNQCPRQHQDHSSGAQLGSTAQDNWGKAKQDKWATSQVVELRAWKISPASKYFSSLVYEGPPEQGSRELKSKLPLNVCLMTQADIFSRGSSLKGGACGSFMRSRQPG